MSNNLLVRGVVSCLVFIVANVNCAFADSALQEKVKSAADSYVSDRFFNAVYAFNDGQETFVKGANGVYSVADGTLLVADQQMPVASVTKSMTAAGILKLKDRNKLDVNDSVAKHLGEKSGVWKDNVVPAWASKVNIHHLLTHTSGLPEYFMAMELNVDQPLDKVVRDMVNFAGSKELSFEPGSQYQYINTNYVLLGLIIEQVSGKTLGQFYQDEIFSPLGMNDTRLVPLEEAVQGQIDPASVNVPVRYFVTPTGDKPQFNQAQASFIMVPYADGGVISTTADIIKWHQALHSGKVVSEDSLNLMKTKYYKVTDSGDTEGNSYVGYGLFITELADGSKIYHHAGRALAIRCESGFIPGKGLYYAVLSNVMDYVPEEMKDKIDFADPKNQLDIKYFTQSVFNAI